MFINPIVGVYIPIIGIPIKGGMTIPNIATFDHGTYMDSSNPDISQSTSLISKLQICSLRLSPEHCQLGGHRFVVSAEPQIFFGANYYGKAIETT